MLCKKLADHIPDHLPFWNTRKQWILTVQMLYSDLNKLPFNSVDTLTLRLEVNIISLSNSPEFLKDFHLLCFIVALYIHKGTEFDLTGITRLCAKKTV